MTLLFNIHGLYFLIECDLHCYNLTISISINLQYQRLNVQYLLKTGESLSAESLIVYPYAKVQHVDYICVA